MANDNRAALFNSDLPTEEPAFLSQLTHELAEAGYRVETIDDTALCDADRFSADTFDLLVIPDAAVAPSRSMPSITEYLQAGGDIIALNAPLWQKNMVNIDGQCMSREAYRKKAAGELPEHVVVANWWRCGQPRSNANSRRPRSCIRASTR